MTLHIFVQVWCEIDPTANVRIDRQSGQAVVDEGDQLQRVSPLGRAGIAAAWSLGQEVTAFALGAGHTNALGHALAAGADRAVELLGDGNSFAALADWLKDQKADLVIADHLAGLVAGRLGWAHLAGLDNLEIRDNMVRAVRFLERGEREIVKARLPAAVRLRNESLRVPYLARARIQAASSLPIERVILPIQDDINHKEPTGPLQMARPRTRIGQTQFPPTTSASQRLGALMGLGNPRAVVTPKSEKAASTPDELAEEFVRYLAHHNLLAVLKKE